MHFKADHLAGGIIVSNYKSEITHPARGLVFFVDLALSLLASLLAILLVRWVAEPIPGFSFIVLKWLLTSVVASFVAFRIFRTQNYSIRYFSKRQLIGLTGACLVKEAFLLAILLIGWLELPDMVFYLLALLGDFVMTVGLVIFSRLLVSTLLRDRDDVMKLASKGAVLIFGTGPDSVSLADSTTSSGLFTVAGFVSSDPSEEGMMIGDNVVWYCKDASDMERLQWRLGGIDGILFPKGAHMSDEGKDKGVPVKIEDGMSGAGHVVKRTFDVLLSGILLIVFSPLMAICAIAVRREDGGPAIYSQERVGRNGKTFRIYKFRSMRPDAEEGSGPSLYSGEGDERLTKVGAFLRTHHLDELPQLWNVFKGDMSFIGYRPERQYYIDMIMDRNPRYRYLYQIRPGVTSYATLYNGYTDTMEKMLTRLDLDLYYLRNHSVLFDMKVLGLTFLGILTGRKF